MTPSQKSNISEVKPKTERTSDHAPTDWQARKGRDKVPFDIIVLTQTPVKSELDLIFEHGAEPAAKFRGDARIYRLNDNRFAIMAMQTSVLNSPPESVEFWNWWARTPMPSFSDLTTSKEISQKIEQLTFLREEGQSSVAVN